MPGMRPVIMPKKVPNTIVMISSMNIYQRIEMASNMLAVKIQKSFREIVDVYEKNGDYLKIGFLYSFK